MNIGNNKDFEISDAYWLSPHNEIYPVKITHIRFILDNSELFATTKQDLIEIYQKYNEKIGWEGKAREEIMTKIIEQGWIRIRNNGNKGWSLQTWDLDINSKMVISNWASKMTIYFKENMQVIDNKRVTVSMLSKIKKDIADDLWYIETNIGEMRDGKI